MCWCTGCVVIHMNTTSLRTVKIVNNLWCIISYDMVLTRFILHSEWSYKINHSIYRVMNFLFACTNNGTNLWLNLGKPTLLAQNKFQEKFLDIFPIAIFIAQLDKATIKLSCCQVWDTQLISAKRYGCFYTTR